MAGSPRGFHGSSGAEGHVGASPGTRRRRDSRSRGEGNGERRQKRQEIDVGVSLEEIAGAEKRGDVLDVGGHVVRGCDQPRASSTLWVLLLAVNSS